MTKVAKFIREAHSMQIEMLPPDINEADLEFVATKKGIRFAMSGIKGVSSGAVGLILQERAKGPFKNLYEFVQRIDKGKIGKKQIELLIDAGSFDFTNWSRDAMRLSLDGMYDEASRDQKEAERGVLNLFSLLEVRPGANFEAPPIVSAPTPKMKLLQREKELLGFYLTGHPMDSYRKALSMLSCVPFKEFERIGEGLVRAAFVVETVQVKVSSKSQRKFAILAISDGIERFELPIWPELYEEKVNLLRENQLLYGILQIETQSGGVHLQAKFLDDLTTVDEAKIKLCEDTFDKLRAQNKPSFKGKQGKAAPAMEKPKKEEENLRLRIKANAQRLRFSHILALKQLLRDHPGKCPIEIQITPPPGQKAALLQIDASWGIKADQAFKEKLHTLAQTLSLQWELTE